MTQKNDFSDFDKQFHAWVKKNPKHKFSDFSVARTAAGLKKNRPHASLSLNLNGGADWKKHGLSAYKNLTKHHHIRKSDKTLDYGCGSLRVGVHFIKQHNLNCYFGLDVSRDFIAYGKKALGNQLHKKQVKTGTIKDNMDEARAFNPDVVFCVNVVTHVHPDELHTFYQNIKSLVQEPESVVILHVMVSDELIRYKREGWAGPLEHYHQAMAPLIPIAITRLGAYSHNGYDMVGCLITYQHPI